MPPKAGPPVFLTDIGVAALDGILFAIGGYDQYGVLHDSVWQYDPILETWLAGTPLLQPRRYVAVGVIDGVLYAAGGTTVTGEPEPVPLHEAFVPLVPVESYTCSPSGFLPPFDAVIGLMQKQQRAIPVKMLLRDSTGNIVSDASIEPPVVVVEYTPLGGTAFDVTDELLPLGAANEGNIYRYDLETSSWIYNLSTKFFLAAGTYRVSAQAGDTSYAIDSSYSGTLVRHP